MLRAVNFLEGFCVRVIEGVYEVGLDFVDYVMTFEEAKESCFPQDSSFLSGS